MGPSPLGPQHWICCTDGATAVRTRHCSSACEREHQQRPIPGGQRRALTLISTASPQQLLQPPVLPSPASLLSLCGEAVTRAGSWCDSVTLRSWAPLHDACRLGFISPWRAVGGSLRVSELGSEPSCQPPTVAAPWQPRSPCRAPCSRAATTASLAMVLCWDLQPSASC